MPPNCFSGCLKATLSSLKACRPNPSAQVRHEKLRVFLLFSALIFVLLFAVPQYLIRQETAAAQNDWRGWQSSRHRSKPLAAMRCGWWATVPKPLPNASV